MGLPCYNSWKKRNNQYLVCPLAESDTHTILASGVELTSEVITRDKEISLVDNTSDHPVVEGVLRSCAPKIVPSGMIRVPWRGLEASFFDEKAASMTSLGSGVVVSGCGESIRRDRGR